MSDNGLSALCECGHAWREHKPQGNGARACAHYGCGCRDVVAPWKPKVHDPAPLPYVPPEDEDTPF